MVPVSHPWQNDLLEIAKQPLKRLALFGRAAGNLPADIPRLHAGRYGHRCDVAEEVGHPVSQLMGVLPEFLGVHGTIILPYSKNGLSPSLPSFPFFPSFPPRPHLDDPRPGVLR